MLENAKYEQFAQLVAFGHTGVQAYRDAVSTECTTKTAMEAASRLLANCKISTRVAELRILADETLEKRLGWNKEKAMRYLVEILETPVGEVDENHRLAQEVTRDEIGGQQGKLRRGDADEGNEITSAMGMRVKIKLPSKTEAMKQLAAMTTWNEPEKVEVTHSGTIEHTHSFDGVLKSIIDSGSPVTRRLEKAREREVEVIPLEPAKKKK